MKKPTNRKARNLWRIELESGDAFTLEANDKGDAIDKAIKMRGRMYRIAKIENVAVLMATGKI